MSHIAVVGSANIDLSTLIPKIPEQGETIKCSKSTTSPGGKGANQAVAAAKMGADVLMIAKVGNDSFGKMVITNLQENGVNAENILVTGESETGKAIVLVCKGDNRIIVDSGSNEKLTVEDIESLSGKLLTSGAVLLQLEIPIETVKRTIETCKGKVPIFLNPAPTVMIEDEFLKGIDYFIPNEIECLFYTGIRPTDKTCTENALDALRLKGIRYPVITLGSKGVGYFNGERNVIEKGFAIEPVDSTAAGDTFSGVFAAMICSGKNIDEAVKIAQAAAAITCTRYGAQYAIPFKKDVETFLKEQSASSFT